MRVALLLVIAASFWTESAFAVDLHFARKSGSVEFKRGGHETGLLSIRRRTPNAAEFDLVAGWSPNGQDSNVGEIRKATMEISGSRGHYTHREVGFSGTCALTFSFSSRAVVVTQEGHCPSFGGHVNASGKYERAEEPSEGVVRRAL